MFVGARVCECVHACVCLSVLVHGYGAS